MSSPTQSVYETMYAYRFLILTQNTIHGSSDLMRNSRQELQRDEMFRVSV